MAKLTYSEQLKHPNWQRRRLEMLAEAKWVCQGCEATEKTLHVHHRQYFKGRMAWEYADDELKVLCETCHAAEHADEELLKQLLLYQSAAEPVAMLGGFLLGDDRVPEATIEAARQANMLAFAVGFIAYLAYHLDIDRMRDVAQHIAAMLPPRSEPRLNFEHRDPCVFGEEENEPCQAD
jgi:hypothetical protein